VYLVNNAIRTAAAALHAAYDSCDESQIEAALAALLALI